MNISRSIKKCVSIVSNIFIFIRDKFFSAPLYFHFIIQAILLCLIIYISISLICRGDALSISSSIISLLAGVFSLYEYYTKSKNLQIEIKEFNLESDHYFETFKQIINQHSANQIDFSIVEDQTIQSNLQEWQKYHNIELFEYHFIETYIGHLCSINNFSDSIKLFLLHRIITSSYNLHFPKFTNSFNVDLFFDPSSVFYDFIKILYIFQHNGSFKLNENITPTELSTADINETINIALKRETKKIKELLQDNESKANMQFLLHKCFENAYTNIGNIARLIKEGEDKVTFLFKYDERFRYIKLEWKEAIETELKKTYTNETDLKEELDKQLSIFNSIIFPYPFSKAISDFSQCISQIGRDKFSYIVEPEHFPDDSKGLTPEEFIKKRVIINAKRHLKKLNRELTKAFPYLKNNKKDTLDANYYIFYFAKKDFFSYAERDTIPMAFQRLLVSDIIDSEGADNHIASQLIYMKQIMNIITFSGLLFTEDFDTQEMFRNIENKLINKLKKDFQLPLNNIYSIASVGNNIVSIISISYNLIYKKELKRKSGKEYNFIKKSVETAVQNANKLINIFQQLKS